VKRFPHIDPFFSSETFSYQSCFEDFNLLIHPSLSLVNPFTTNGLMPLGAFTRDQALFEYIDSNSLFIALTQWSTSTSSTASL
jgi:hypothetical protein